MNSVDINVVALRFAIETAKSSGVYSAAQIITDAHEYAAFLETPSPTPEPATCACHNQCGCTEEDACSPDCNHPVACAYGED